MASRERIMLVDDESVFAEAFRRTFEARNYEVVTAASKAQAEELMGLQPDIIILGTLVPAGQAFAFHQWLKRHPSHKNVPLLVVDAKYEERSIKGWRKFEGMQLESDDYVSKPIEPSALVPRVRTLLEQATRVIRVLVVDDHTMVREGIEAVLAQCRTDGHSHAGDERP
jgi:DNA-binding response OmpR family regulator